MSPASVETRLQRLERERGESVPAQAKTKPPTPLEFIESLSIDDRVSGTAIPFRLWPAQKALLADMASSERLVVAKARQLGISHLALALELYYATFEAGQLFLIARQGLEESIEGIVRLRRMNETVPERWRQPTKTDNALSIGFGNGSRIRALSSARSIGRGLASRYAILDELAFLPSPEEQYAAIEPGAQRLHVISTGNGRDFFFELYHAALVGEGRWVARFLPWTCDPRRDEAWRRANVELAPSPSLAAREHAATEADAFSSPAGVFFARFDSARNVDDIEPAANWQTVRGIDWGYHSPACVWAQISPAGQPFVVHEYLPHEVTTDEYTAGICREDAKLALAIPPHTSYCDPAGAAVNVQVRVPEVESAKRAGLHPVYRTSLVREGCTRLMDALADPVLPLVVSTRCPFLIEALGSAKVDPNAEGQYVKDGHYEHALDALRYLVLHLHLGPAPEYELPEPSFGASSGAWGRVW